MPTTTDTEMAVRFNVDTANHTMTVLRDDGLYRHLRFKAPNRGSYWFDLVTWPGYLVVVGDVGTSCVFTRTPDMFEFFRGGAKYGIKPGYWAEKLVSDRDVAQKFSETRFRQLIDEQVDEWIRDYDGDDPGFAKSVREQVGEHGLREVYDESDARRALDQFEFVPADGQRRIDAAELVWSDATSRGATKAERDAAWAAFNRIRFHEAYRFDNTGEWDLTDWHWSFLWCCHAIVSGIGQYDASKATVAADVAVSR